MLHESDTEGYHLNDPRIERIEQLTPAVVPTYAIYRRDPEQKKNFDRERIHLWAHVRLTEGGTAIIGLTLHNLNTSGHAEHDMPGREFMEYEE